MALTGYTPPTHLKTPGFITDIHSLHPVTMNAPIMAEDLPGNRHIYYWCFDRMIPPGGWSFDMWSKQPNYWTGYLLYKRSLHNQDEGPLYLRLLHEAALVEGANRGIDINERLSEAIARAQAFNAPANDPDLVQGSSDGVGEQIDPSSPALA